MNQQIEYKTFEHALREGFGYPDTAIPKLLRIIQIEAQAAAGVQGVSRYGLIPDATLRNSQGWMDLTLEEERLAREICGIRGVSEDEWQKQGGPKLIIDGGINPLYELPFENEEMGAAIIGVVGELRAYWEQRSRSLM